MSNYLLVIAIIAAQMGVFTLAWMLVGHLRLAPYLAGASIVCNASLGVAMALISARAWLPEWIGLVVANAFVVLAMLAMRRGISRFAATPTSKLEDLFILGLSSFALWVSMIDVDGSLRVAASQGPLTYLLLRTAWIARHRLVEEFGERTARLCALPIFLIGALQLARLAGSLAWPGVFVPSIDRPTTTNVAFTMAVMIAGLCINMTMLTMVILRVVRRLDHLTRQDPMTGLLNRRAIEDALRHEVGLARRAADTRFALLAVDVDHFKRINDSHGHPVGDAALVALARTLRESARTGDMVARVGGEEFWVLLPNTDTTGAFALAERIRSDVACTPLEVGASKLPVTVSIGVAVFEDQLETPQQLFARADKALYQAKAAGRNRCQMAPALRHGAHSGFVDSLAGVV